MATAFDTFEQYAFGHYPGQIEDRSMADVVSLIASGSDIGYGLGVIQTGERTAELPTGSEVSSGITVRETVRDNDASDDPEYQEGRAMSVIRVGRVWAATANGSAYGDPVFVVPATGGLTNDLDGSATGMAAGGNTGDGTIGSVDAVAGAIPGDYVAVCTATATDGGTFTVFDPDGQVIGEAEVGSAFDNGVQFTISDGATDFAEGDRFTITVTAANTRLPDAVFKSAASAGEMALVQLNGAE